MNGEGLVQDASSPVCGVEEETVEDTILLCDWSKKVSFGSSLKLHIGDEQIPRLDKWIFEKCQLLRGSVSNWKDAQALLFNSCCWAIWK